MNDFLSLLLTKSRINNIFKNPILLIEQEKNSIFLLLSMLMLVAIAFLLQEYKGTLLDATSQKKLLTNIMPSYIEKKYPIITTIIPEYTGVSAESAIILDDDSQVVLFAKNAQQKLPMASTTKIMTALTALEYFQLDDLLTIQSVKIEGSVVGFKKGEIVSFKNLLYGMLLPSGNDAATAIAQNYPGGESAFVAKMNENAKTFHLENTHYADPTGLTDEENGDYTTALDLARLSSLAMKNHVLAQIVGTKQAVIGNENKTLVYPLHNLNQLLGEDGIVGIKTGFTEKSGGVLATAKKENGRLLIVIVMKSEDRFADTQALLSIVSGNISYVSL